MNTMKITPIREIVSSFHDISTPDSSRRIAYTKFEDVVFCGRNLHYPNLLLHTSSQLISPYDERVMSLKCDSFYEKNIYTGPLYQGQSRYVDSVFFFALNVDNYFHFIYDSLPYLYYYIELKKTLPSLKLLVQTSSPTKQSLPMFVTESFSLLGIDEYILLEKDVQYKEVYVGLSMTHGGQSNEPPHPSAFFIWNQMSASASSFLSSDLKPIDKLYISRRSWLSKHPENIGTNYTLRRKCVNEDALVSYLESKGYTEVFCEDMTMAEKLFYFSNAKAIVGIIGGGLCNALFSKKNTVLHCLNTPAFLDINQRFLFSMQHTRLSVHSICSHAAHEGPYTLYTRAKILDEDSPLYDKIGEISSYLNGQYELKVAKEAVAGFSQDFAFDSVYVDESKLAPLDGGLNSPFVCDLDTFKQKLDKEE
jgi:hypothetical protein